MLRLLASAVLATALALPVAATESPPPAPADTPSRAFDATAVEVVAERDLPQACFTFSERLDKAPQVNYRSFVTLDPPRDVTVFARDKALCVEGLGHGSKVAITLLDGLPGAGGVRLTAARRFDVEVPNRATSLSFRGAGYILSQVGPEGLPLRTINVDSARLQVIRIGDRKLVEKIYFGKLSQTLSTWDIGELVEKNGQPVWKGEMAISGARNTPAVTPFPIDQFLGRLEPGVYLAVAEAGGTKTTGWDAKAAQWFVVSDLALTTFVSEGGLLVFARQLDTARPAKDVQLRLLARNNAELGAATTDADGIARFDSGAIRGTEGSTPQAVFAYGATGDFSILDLASSGVPVAAAHGAGSDANEPLDAFLYTDRGIYRPGEMVYLSALLRTTGAAAAAGRKLSIKVLRPDGFEADRLEATDAGDGGYAVTVALPPAAFPGTWTVTAQLDPQGPVIGKADFLVEDFVPPRLEFSIAADSPSLNGTGGTALSIAARYLYGAAAARLPGELSMTLRAAETPFPEFGGYRFGLAQDKFTPIKAELPGFTTNVTGKARVDLAFDKRPETSHPLEAVVRATIFDVGGRPVRRELVLPVQHQPFAIGVRPGFEDGAVPEGATVAFDVVAVDGAGHRIERPELSYELYEEENEFVWFEADGRWDYKTVVHDHRVTGGKLNVPAIGPAKVEEQVKAGRYRFEVFDSQTGVASSVRFAAGWWVRPITADRPDKVDVTVMLPGYTGGDTAWVYVRPPYRSQMLIVLADRMVRKVQTREVGPEGAFLDFPVDPSWTAGVHVVATAFEPSDPRHGRQPRRALGLGWLAIDSAPRLLQVALTPPQQSRSSQTLMVPLTVTGAEPGAPVHATVTAVDDAVLRLTDSLPADPVGYYLGRRPLGIDVRDVFGRLIEPAAAERAPVSSGGPRGPLRQDRSQAQSRAPVVALFSGVLTLDAEGKALVPLALPVFAGRLRLTAVAWTANRLGRGDAGLVVSDPVVADVAAPRFLAPDDQADVTLVLSNLGTAGAFEGRLSVAGSLTLADDGAFQIRRIEPGGRATVVRRLIGGPLGAGTLHLVLSGPDGFTLDREWAIPVRPVVAPVIRRSDATLAAGQKLALADEFGAGLRPDSVQAALGLGPLPEFGLPGLLAALDRYPYACGEQLASRALSLVGRDDGLPNLGQATTEPPRARLNRLIAWLFALQRADGAFAQWSPQGEAELWLTAYVLDVFGRARATGALVPEGSYRLGLDWLRRLIDNAWFEDKELPGRAYAIFVLARAKAIDAAAVGYFQQTYGARLQTDLARAHLGAALALVGDPRHAAEAFDKIGGPRQPVAGLRDFGSELRDAAGALALAAESGVPAREKLVDLADKLNRKSAASPAASTQEQAWLALAARVLGERAGPFKLTIDGTTTDQTKTYYRRLESAGDTPAIVNPNPTALYQTLTVSGVPAAAEAVANGFTIARSVFDMSGKPATLDHIRHNDLLVVILDGASQDGRDHQAMVVDRLPAGFEVENVRLANSAQLGDLSWLGEISAVRHVEARDDRFVAALDLDRDHQGFRLVYLVRAVIPGQFTVPGPTVTDMYHAELAAHGLPTQLTINPE
ncbi:MAG: alpha-2-macroglobulin family protein [Azospirillum sp.]|nr:alpha-2-macroglobulin family protein [Azospirillum sp.]